MTNRHLPTAVGLLGMALVLTACGGKEERKVEHLNKGIAFFESGNIDKASIEFKNVLQIDPKTAKPYYYLGRIEEKRTNWPQAFGDYQKAVELDPNDLDARLRLAQILLLAKQPDQSAEMLAPVIKARPTDIEVRLVQAAVSNAKGDSDGARKILESMIAEKTQRPEPYVVLATLYSRKSNFTEAEKTLQSGLAIDPKSVQLLATLATLYETRKEWAKSESTVQQLRQINAHELQYPIMLAELYVKQNRLQDAETTLEQTIREFPEEVRPVMLLAEFEARQGNVQKAEENLKAGLIKHPQSVELIQGLGTLYLKTKRPEQAEQVYRQFIETNARDHTPETMRARNQLAEILAAGGRTADASKLVEEILEHNAEDQPALLLKGKLAMKEKKPQDAIAAFRAVLRDQPDNVEVLSLLASALELDGKPALVQETLEKAVKLKPDDFALRRNLAKFFLQQKDTPRAMEQADQLIKDQPNNFEAYNLKADILVINNQEDALETLLKDMKTRFPDQPLVAMRLGQLYIARKQPEQALAEFESVLKKNTQNPYEALKAEMAIFLDLKQPAKAEARIRKFIAANPKYPGAQQLLALYYIAQNKPEESIKSLNKAIELNPNWLLPYQNLGMIHERMGHPEEAIIVYQKALSIAPNDAQLHMNLGRAYDSARQFDKAASEFESVIKTNPGNLVAINNLASVLSLSMGGEQNIKRGLELVKPLETSDQPVFMDTVGWLYHLNGNNSKAVELLVKAVEKAPGTAIFQYHLGMVEAATGDKVKAREHLLKSLELGGPKFTYADDARKTLKSLE